MEIAVFIFEARITCVIVSLESTKILLNVFVIVVEDSVHERRWQRLFHINCAHLVWFAFNTSCRVNDFYVISWQWFASRSWFLGEGFEAKIVRKYGASSLGLPVAIIDKFSFKMFLHPFKSRYIATLAY